MIKGMSLIAAVADNNIIGANNEIPWYISEDFKRFKSKTLGHAVVMGRKTYESILKKLNKPLPGRLNLVVTNRSDYSPGNFDNAVAAGLEEALEKAASYRPDGLFIVAGGEQIYKQTIEHAERLFITHVCQSPWGDAFFPTIKRDIWKETFREDHDGYSFVDYERIDGK